MGVAVEVFQREAGQLGVGVAAQPVDRALRHPGHDVGEQPGESGGQQIDKRGQRQDLAEPGEIDPMARHYIGARNQIGDSAVPLRSEAGDRLCLADAGGQALADDAVEDDVGRVADDLGPDHGAGHAAQRQDGGDDDASPLRPKPRQELTQRLAQVFGLLRWQHPAEPAAAHWSARRRPPARVTRNHATASSPSCEATISR